MCYVCEYMCVVCVCMSVYKCECGGGYVCEHVRLNVYLWVIMCMCVVCWGVMLS